MFTFPRAQQVRRWEGQGDLLGGGMPYFGVDSLGVCFGFSSLWVKLGAPYACFDVLQGESQAVIKAQRELTQAMHVYDVLMALGVIAESVIGRNSVKETAYANGVASHIVLDILQSVGARHFVVSFYFSAGPQGAGGHAIGVSFDAGQTGRLFDPNYGIGSYQSRTDLSNDLHALLASYVVPGGHVTQSYLLEFGHVVTDDDFEFGAFQSAADFH
ncbi:YopT-type cysteine protease domain-containing protein [Pseudomonas sp. Pdm06]|uniref:YopT-type cysteine protease domain-containing protein n=1 Tax=Pseudomonas sp. Pdm06 TaxID=1790044 RepID=UPI00177FEEE7|nr:YopT-type cysteine protease domain-containing protein [Pseudomonas sp. Pdm06]MBD9463226.1 hypothetical protein [Pseudomonas sp. Pdm06]